MSDIITGNRSANRTYLTTVTKRLNDLASLKKKVADRRAKTTDAKKAAELDKLLADINKATDVLGKEKQIRLKLEEAYKASKSKAPDDDPAVKASMTALNNHRSKAYPSYYANNSKVGDPCIPCLTSRLEGEKPVKDTAVPVWTTTPYGSGPYYKATRKHTMASFKGWDDLINKKVKTKSEKDALIAVAGNEGEFDQPQSWDSEAVSLGVMQKTVNSQGTGELPLQVLSFKKQNPAKYKELFADKGWTVSDSSPPKMYFKDPKSPSMKPVTGAALKSYIRQKNRPDIWKKTLGPLREAGQDIEFQKKQVLDYNSRLVSAVSQKPTGYKYPIKGYVTSEKGAGMVLDHSVNRPAYVAPDFAKALNRFYANNPGVSKNPGDWPADKRAGYEKQILSNYGDVRRMTDSQGRRKHIMGDDNLSGTPGSMKWP